VLSTTLCYSAFGFANLAVDITSSGNRTEPETVFDAQNGRYTFHDVRRAFGQDSALSRQDRGVLELEKRNWVNNNTTWTDGIEPFMRSFADLSAVRTTETLGDGNYGNVSCIMSTKSSCPPDTVIGPLLDVCTTPDIMHLWLLQEILHTGGSMAFTLQTMITLLSSMAYYDQIGQFDNVSLIEQTFFAVTNVPVSARGFILVTVIAVIHLSLVIMVLILFLRGTHLSQVGAAWSAIAQVVQGDGKPYIEQAALSGDAKIEEIMVKDGLRSSRAGIKKVDGRVISVVTTRETTKES